MPNYLYLDIETVGTKDPAALAEIAASITPPGNIKKAETIAEVLSDSGNDRIVMGGNLSPFDEVVLEIDDLYAEAANWADGTPIESQEQCDALDVLDKALLDAGKRLDALRVEEKRPLDDRIQAIQDRYNPYVQPKKGRVDLARACLNPLRAAWKEAERKRKEAKAEAAHLDAEKLQREAEEKLRASSGNLVAREQAEEAVSLAKEATQFANRTGKAATTGLGLRTSYRALLADGAKAAEHYWATRPVDFQTFLSELAAQDIRRGIRSIPGFDVIEETKAI